MSSVWTYLSQDATNYVAGLTPVEDRFVEVNQFSGIVKLRKWEKTVTLPGVPSMGTIDVLEVPNQIVWVDNDLYVFMSLVLTLPTKDYLAFEWSHDPAANWIDVVKAQIWPLYKQNVVEIHLPIPEPLPPVGTQKFITYHGLPQGALPWVASLSGYVDNGFYSGLKLPDMAGTQYLKKYTGKLKLIGQPAYADCDIREVVDHVILVGDRYHIFTKLQVDGLFPVWNWLVRPLPLPVWFTDSQVWWRDAEGFDIQITDAYFEPIYPLP